MATREEITVEIEDFFITECGYQVSQARYFTGELFKLEEKLGVVIKGRYCGMSHLDIWREVFTVEPLVEV